jgi:hypothetical protein
MLSCSTVTSAGQVITGTRSLLGYGAYTKRMKIESLLNIKNSFIIKWW